MSSTAIVIPVLVESKRLGAPVGRASLSVLLFQDLAVAPLLVMAGAVASGSERGLGWALFSALVPAALALAALIVFGRMHRGLPRVTLGLGISILSAVPYSPFTWLTLHPLTQIGGLRRATRRARPAASAASTTALTSL